MASMVRVPGACTEIEFKSVRFLITERPSDIGMINYLEDLKRYNVLTVVRVCEATYSPEKLNSNGISVMDLSFPDGSPPPQEVIDAWFELLRTRFAGHPEACVAVHCVAGLGRAPVLVALALMELGMKYEDAVELIRTKRRGAINSKQLAFLERYKPKSRLKVKGSNGAGNCLIA